MIYIYMMDGIYLVRSRMIKRMIDVTFIHSSHPFVQSFIALAKSVRLSRRVSQPSLSHLSLTNIISPAVFETEMRLL